MASKQKFLIYGLFFIIVNLIKCEEDLLKNSKVLSCVSLARGAIRNERNLIESIAGGFQSGDKGEISSKILTLLIVKCYRNISREQSIQVLTELNARKEGKEMTWKSEYKGILGLNGDVTDDIDSDGFLEDFKEVNKILKELNDEAKTIKDSKQSEPSTTSKKTTPKKEQTQSKQSKQNISEPSFPTKLLLRILSLFDNIFSLIGFDSIFGVGITIFLVFILSYLLRVTFTGGRPDKKRKPAKIKKAEEETKSD